MDSNYIIETKNLTKQYGSQKSVADLNILSVADTSLNTSRAVGAEGYFVFVTIEYIVLLAAFHLHVTETLPVFKAFDSVDTEHGITQGGMKLAENRLSQSDRASLYDTADNTTDGVAFSFCLVNVVSHLLGKFLIRTAYRIVFDGTQIVCSIVFI